MVASSEAGEFLVRLGGAMCVAGESVDAVRGRMLRIGHAYGLPQASIVVLPTALFIDTGRETGRVYLNSRVGESYRLDQIAALYELVKLATDGEVEPGDGLARLDAIDVMPPGLPWSLRVLGHGIMSAGLALLFQPTAAGLVGATLLGVMVGFLKLADKPTLQLVLPVVASFLAATIVLSMPKTFDQPIYVLIPPLISLLPGGVLTTGTVELAAGQMMSGAGRLVYGAVKLMLLAFGILAAAALLDIESTRLIHHAHEGLGWWVTWLGVLVVGIGYFVHFTAPWRALPWIMLVMVVAYGGQLIGAQIFDAELSGFFGALAMTPLILWLDDADLGPPSMVTFLPGFWLLVPGAGGLIGVTELVGQNRAVGVEDFVAAVVSILSIALGVLIGTALYRTVRSGYRTATEGLQTIVATPPVQRFLDLAENPWVRRDEPGRRGPAR